MSLIVETRQDQGLTHVVLRGAIDEHAPIQRLADIPGPRIVIDMSGVDRMNSLGINRWLPALQKLSTKFPTTVVRLSYAVARQAANLTNLFASASIESTLAPYYCPGCNATPALEITREEYTKTNRPPERVCSTCGGALQFDELEEYFDFLRRGPGSAP
jgi:anti-anti-sigma regulatory factor